MTIDQLAAALVVAVMFMGPLVVLAVSAARFGTDSRPGVGDRDQRPWLVPNR